ncbi:site-specific integrase [Shewanella baltica]|uniref:site-specific integrase n=1 Tax=Shewanella baltica TaxID=62322 RepID=UPI00217CCC3E|nr:site-specific integrase [Shewanella baltica]MCS6190688.1 site-specific integrase [Shewanella baltica]
MTNKKHLRLRGNTWYFQKTQANGKLFSKSLKTDSLKEAIHHRDILLREMSALEPEVEKQHPQKRLRKLVHELRADYEKIMNLDDDCYFDDIHSAEDAHKKGDDILADAILIAGEGNLLSPHTGIKLDYTLSEVAHEFLAHIKHSKDITTYNAYKRAIANHLDFSGNKNLYLKNLNRGGALKFITYLSKVKSLSEKSIANQLGGLSGCYQYALDRDFIPAAQNPFNGHRLKELVNKSDSKASNPFTTEEFQFLQSHINHSKRTSEARKWAAPIAMLSGLRFAELLGLYEDDVRQINSVWCFDIKPTDARTLKNVNAKRLVPIHDAILPIVLKLKHDSENEFLFSEVKGNKTIGGTLQTWFSRTKCKQLPESQASFHGLRKNFATALENSLVDVGIAASLMGHAKPTLSYNLYSSGHNIELLKSEINKITSNLSEYIKCFPK